MQWEYTRRRSLSRSASLPFTLCLDTVTCIATQYLTQDRVPFAKFCPSLRHNDDIRKECIAVEPDPLKSANEAIKLSSSIKTVRYMRITDCNPLLISVLCLSDSRQSSLQPLKTIVYALRSAWVVARCVLVLSFDNFCGRLHFPS